MKKEYSKKFFSTKSPSYIHWYLRQDRLMKQSNRLTHFTLSDGNVLDVLQPFVDSGGNTVECSGASGISEAIEVAYDDAITVTSTDFNVGYDDTFSMGCWVKCTAAPVRGTDTYMATMGIFGKNTLDDSFGFSVRADSPYSVLDCFRFACRGNTTNEIKFLSPDLDTWYSLIGVFTKTGESTRTLSFYVNGTQVGSDLSFTGEDFYATDAMKLGGGAIAGGSSADYGGTIHMANTFFLNRALSSGEIESYKDGVLFTGSETNMAAYWPMNEGSGTSIGDLSPNENDITIADATWVTGPSLIANENFVCKQHFYNKQR